MSRVSPPWSRPLPVHAHRGSRSRSRPLTSAAALLAAAVLLLGGVEIAVLYAGPWPDPPWAALLLPIVAWVYLAAGMAAWLRRPGNPLGLVIGAGALVWLAAGLANIAIPVLASVGTIVASVPLALVVHLLHAFPGGRLRGRGSQATVVAAYLVSTLLQMPLYLFGQGAAASAPILQVADRPDLAQQGFWVQTAAGAVVMTATAVILGRRLRRTAPARRRVLAPLLGYGIAAVLAVPVSASTQALLPVSTVALAVAQLSVLAGIPVAFAVAMLRGGFARTAQIEELGAWLGAAEGGRASLAGALAAALGDPSLRLAFWVPEAGGHVDAEGRPVDLPVSAEERAAVEVAQAGRRIGAIVYDATLITDPDLVRSAGRVVALALEHERLTAELRVNRERVRASRARIVGAADAERRRIAQDLHDGLQTRLVLLAMKADRVRASLPNPTAAHTDVAGLQAELQTAIGQLREFVQGVMPAVLTERGLGAAAEELAHRVPIPVELQLDLARGSLPPPIESTGYFVVSEAVTNAIKHAHAHELHLGVAVRNDQLTVTVCDDGIGGARPSDGTGLRGMADRVEALDGRLSIHSPAGGGTRVVAELPCAW